MRKPPRHWKWHYRQLQLLRDHLMAEHSVQVGDVREPFERRSDLADQAADDNDHELALSLVAEEEHAVNEINAAMNRIINGTYGICEASGDPIPDERLRVVPWTRYTTHAQERLEQERLGLSAWRNAFRRSQASPAAMGRKPGEQSDQPRKRTARNGHATNHEVIRNTFEVSGAAAPKNTRKI